MLLARLSYPTLLSMLQAYDVLSDDKKRQQYDAVLKQKAVLEQMQAEAGGHDFEDEVPRCVSLLALNTTTFRILSKAGVLSVIRLLLTIFQEACTVKSKKSKRKSIIYSSILGMSLV